MSPVHVPAGDRAVPVDDLAVHAFDIPVDGPDGKEQDGTLSPAGGALCPDPGRPGLGLEAKWADLEQYRVYGRGRG